MSRKHLFWVSKSNIHMHVWGGASYEAFVCRLLLWPCVVRATCFFPLVVVAVSGFITEWLLLHLSYFSGHESFCPLGAKAAKAWPDLQDCPLRISTTLVNYLPKFRYECSGPFCMPVLPIIPFLPFMLRSCHGISNNAFGGAPNCGMRKSRQICLSASIVFAE